MRQALTHDYSNLKVRDVFNNFYNRNSYFILNSSNQTSNHSNKIKILNKIKNYQKLNHIHY